MGSVYAQMNNGTAIDKVFKASSAKGVTFSNGMIIIKHERAKALFTPVVDEIVAHTKNLLKHPKLKKMRYILMVGGFSECLILQTEIRKHFHENGCKVLVPSEAQLAIIKGAVLYGHMPEEINKRITKYSYGVATIRDFDERIHDNKHKLTFCGIAKCEHLFSCFIAKNKEVKFGEKIIKRFSNPTTKKPATNIHIYQYDGVPSKPVQYVTAEGMKLLGSIECNTPERGKHLEIAMTFGGTEIQVDVGNRDGSTSQTVTAVIDFLAQ